ncbi:MAG: AMP-binding protein [Spirochaetaceae bacterium]|nr:AMP-binding protein [Spirochaetaceae bacterium]
MYALGTFSLAELVPLSARHYGNRPALSMVGGKDFSYNEIDMMSRRFGLLLQNQGLRKGDKVAILAENSPYWGIAYFGIIRAGATAVPILTDFTSGQIGNIIGHSEAKFVLCSDKFFQKISAQELKATILDIKSGIVRFQQNPEVNENQPALLELDPADFKPEVCKPEDVAMIIYTSGTTGLSKGVMLSHKNILSNALACRSIIILHRQDRLLSVLPLAHTYEFTIGFIIPLLAGSHIFYIDKPPSTTVLLPALAFVRPTLMLTVPLVIEKTYKSTIKPSLEKMKLYKNRLVRPLLIKVAGAKLKKTFGGRLRFFGVGGAPLAPDCEEFLKKAGFPYAIGYGLTETSPLLAGSAPGKTILRSTGPALKGVSLRIASPRPDSGDGELEAKGDNIFLGYYKDPERTKEAFTEDGWFKTGDLGFLDSKQRLFIRGRSKTMILGASGENIYPEEIEAILNQSPHVAESLVMEEDGALVAIVCLKSSTLDDLEAKIQDTIEEAGLLSSQMGTALANAEKSLSQSFDGAISDASKSIRNLLEGIRKETNAKLASFSKIHTIQFRREPFEKTPTQKIKRFLYSGKQSKQSKQSKQ